MAEDCVAPARGDQSHNTADAQLAELGFKVFHWTTCPECGGLAEVTDHAAVESSDGPVELVRLTCVVGHHIFADVEIVEREQGRFVRD